MKPKIFSAPAVTFASKAVEAGAEGEPKTNRAELDRLLSLTETGRGILKGRGMTHRQIEELRNRPNPALAGVGR